MYYTVTYHTELEKKNTAEKLTHYFSLSINKLSPDL